MKAAGSTQQPHVPPLAERHRFGKPAYSGRGGPGTESKKMALDRSPVAAATGQGTKPETVARAAGSDLFRASLVSAPGHRGEGAAPHTAAAHQHSVIQPFTDCATKSGESR